MDHLPIEYFLEIIRLSCSSLEARDRIHRVGYLKSVSHQWCNLFTLSDTAFVVFGVRHVCLQQFIENYLKKRTVSCFE